MQARIKEKRDVAKGTLMVVFDLLGEEVEFTAGQYFWVTLLDPPYDDDKDRAAISRWSRRRTSGACWAWPARSRLSLQALARGAARRRAVNVEQPKGDFLPDDTEPPYAFIAGGIGITVFRSMLRYIAEEKLPHRVTLVYSNRDGESTAFFDELLELERAIPGLRVVFTMTGDSGWDGEASDRRSHASRPPRCRTQLPHVSHRWTAEDGGGGGGGRERSRRPRGADPPRAIQRLLSLPGELLERQRRRTCEERGPHAERSRAGRVVDELADQPMDARPSKTNTAVSPERKMLCRLSPVSSRS